MDFEQLEKLMQLCHTYRVSSVAVNNIQVCFDLEGLRSDADSKAAQAAKETADKLMDLDDDALLDNPYVGLDNENSDKTSKEG